MQIEQTRTTHPQLSASLDKTPSAKFTPKLSQSQSYLNSQLEFIQNQRNNGFSTAKAKKQLQINNQGVSYDPMSSNTAAIPLSSKNSSQYSSATALMQELINSAKLQQIHKNQNELNGSTQQKQIQKKQGISGSFVLQKEPYNSSNIGMKFLEFSSPSVISTSQINLQLKQRRKPTHKKSYSSSSSDVFTPNILSQPLFPPTTLSPKDRSEQNYNFSPPPASAIGPRAQVNSGQYQTAAASQKNQLPDRIASSSTSQAVHRPKIGPSSSSRTIRVLGLLQPGPMPNPPQLRSSSSTPSHISSSIAKSSASPLSQFVTKVDKVEFPMSGVYPYLSSNNSTQSSQHSPQLSFATAGHKIYHNQTNQKQALSIDSSSKNEDILFYPLTAKHQQAEPKPKRGFTSSKTFSSLNSRAWDRSISSPSNQTLKDSISKCEGLLQSKIDQTDQNDLTPKPQVYSKNQELSNKESTAKSFNKNERTQQQASSFKKLNTPKVPQNSANGIEMDSRKVDNQQQSRPLTDRPIDKVNSNIISQPTQGNNNIINNNYLKSQQQSTGKNFLQENNSNNNQNYRQFNNNNSNKYPNNYEQENSFKLANMSNQAGRVHPESPYYMQSLNKAFKAPFPIDADAQLFRQHFLQTCQGVMYSNLAQPANPRDLVSKKVMLGPRNKKYNKTLIFDMDETLIHCNENTNIPSDVIVELKFPTGKIIKAGINIRPYAKEILRELSQEFEIIIFTASHACYAEEVIKQLDPLRQYVHFRFFRDQCIQSAQGVYIKDLRIFSDRLLQDIVLIDNAAYSFCFQIDNGIPILPFYDNKQDTELLHLATYLRGLNSANDVREYNRQHLKMALFNEPEGPQKVFDKIFKGEK